MSRPSLIFTRWLLPACVLACSGSPTSPAGMASRPVASSMQNESSSGTGPTFLQAREDAPPVTAAEVSFYAVRGEERQGALYYRSTDGNPADSVELVRLVVPREGLALRPDGTRITQGDSVLITMTLVDPEHMIVQFEPSGLQFNPGQPARIELGYEEANPDLNGDGRVDGRDASIESTLGIWRREQPTDPWIALPSPQRHHPKHIGTEIGGFTQYAIAY